MGVVNFEEINLAEQQQVLYKATLEGALIILGDVEQDVWVDKVTQLMVKIGSMKNKITLEYIPELFSSKVEK